jgi:hypothetical protein
LTGYQLVVLPDDAIDYRLVLEKKDSPGPLTLQVDATGWHLLQVMLNQPRYIDINGMDAADNGFVFWKYEHATPHISPDISAVF